MNAFQQFLPMEAEVKNIIWEDKTLNLAKNKNNQPKPIEALLPSVAEAVTFLYGDTEAPLWQEVRTDINTLKYEFLAGKTHTPLKKRVEIFNNYFVLFFGLYASRAISFPHSKHPHCITKKVVEPMASFYASYILGRATEEEIKLVEDIKNNKLANEEVYARASGLDRFNDQLLTIIPYEECLKRLGLTEEDVMSRKEFWKTKKRGNTFFKNIAKVDENMADMKVREAREILKSLYIHYHYRCRGTGLLVDKGVHVCNCMARDYQRKARERLLEY